MPFYDWLRPRDYDSEQKKADKERVAATLLALRSALADHLYGNGSNNRNTHSQDSTKYLRLATWNIREFGSDEKFGPRLPESLYYIAEILSHFDLVAIQEVREDLRALDRVLRILGPNWTYIATDVTGNRERMVFLYNTSKVWFRKIAGEVVLGGGDRIAYPHEERLSFSKGLTLELPEAASLVSPPLNKEDTYRRSGKDRLGTELEIELPELTRVQLPKGTKIVLPYRHPVTLTDDRRVVLPKGTNVDLPKGTMIKLPRHSIVGDTLQFARTPFLVTFQAGWLKLNLCTVHIYYGKGKGGVRRRKQEIRMVTKFLADRASKENHFDADSFFILLGDFNIVGRKHPTMAALESSGFKVPEELQTLPGSNVKKNMYYDQIAHWAGGKGRPDVVTHVDVQRAGVFDFFETVFLEKDKPVYQRIMNKPDDKWDYEQWRTFQMSDHLPMWVELRIDFGDEYLQRIAPNFRELLQGPKA